MEGKGGYGMDEKEGRKERRGSILGLVLLVGMLLVL